MALVWDVCVGREERRRGSRRSQTYSLLTLKKHSFAWQSLLTDTAKDSSSRSSHPDQHKPGSRWILLPPIDRICMWRRTSGSVETELKIKETASDPLPSLQSNYCQQNCACAALADTHDEWRSQDNKEMKKTTMRARKRLRWGQEIGTCNVPHFKMIHRLN